MNPTPTPWRVEAIHAGRASVLAANGYLVALAVGEQEVCDWEHIVRCVNEREALLEALREIEDFDTDAEFDYTDEWTEAAAFSRCKEIARAAIALAEGETP